MAISDWPEQQRPRERLIRDGAAALSDPELLAVFLPFLVYLGKPKILIAEELYFSKKLAHPHCNKLYSADMTDMSSNK